METSLLNNTLLNDCLFCIILYPVLGRPALLEEKFKKGEVLLESNLLALFCLNWMVLLVLVNGD